MTARQGSVPASFGRRLRREREARHWSLRDASGECGVSPSTIQRAEEGRDLALSSALALAGVYGVPVGILLAGSACETCDGWPPAGFACLSCGASAAGAVTAAEGEAGC